MPEYSLRSYVAAARMRSAASLLVEGTTERIYMAQLVAQLVAQLSQCAQSTNLSGVLVDTAEILRSPKRTMGNRQKVERVSALAIDTGARILCFVDREFRKFELGPHLVDKVDGHSSPRRNLIWTRGHSTENYALSASQIMRQVRLAFAEDIALANLQTVELAIAHITAGAAACSLAGYRAGTLARMQGLEVLHCWHVREGTTAPTVDTAAIKRQLEARGCTKRQLTTFSLAFNHYAAALSSSLPIARWVGHGHIATEFVWGGIGAMLRSLGTPLEACLRIASGEKRSKQRQSADGFATACLTGDRMMPQRLQRWILKALAT